MGKNRQSVLRRASVMFLVFMLSMQMVSTVPEERVWESDGLRFAIKLSDDGEWTGEYVNGSSAVVGRIEETDDGLKIGKYAILDSEGEAFTSAEELAGSSGQIQVYDDGEEIKGKTKGWVQGDERLLLTVTDSGRTYAYYDNGESSIEGFVDDDTLKDYGVTPYSTSELISSKSVNVGGETLEKPARFSYGISAGYINTRYLVDYGDDIFFHDTLPGGYLSLDFGVRLDQKARFSFNVGFLTSLTGYLEKMDGDEEYANISELGSVNAGFIGFSYNLKAKEGLPKGVIFSLGATLSNTTLMDENITNIGPTGKLEAYVGIPGKGRYDYLITLGGMVTPSIGSDLFDNGNNDSMSVMYSFGLGFKLSPKGIGGR